MTEDELRRRADNLVHERTAASNRVCASAHELLAALKDLAEAVKGGGYPHGAMKRAEAAIARAGRPIMTEENALPNIGGKFNQTGIAISREEIEYVERMAKYAGCHPQRRNADNIKRLTTIITRILTWEPSDNGAARMAAAVRETE